MKNMTILIGLLLLVVSCDSGGGADPEAAAENVEAGFAALEDALDECNDVSNCDFSEALEAFEDAVQNDPNNTDAQFGLAMIRMVSVINNEDMQALLESLDIGLDRVTGTSIPSTDNILSFIDQINFNQFNPVAFVSSSILDHDEDDMSIEEISEVVNLLHDVIDDVFIPTLSLSINGLNTLLSTNNFEFEITGDMQGDSNQSSMYIREGEIYALKAAMHALRAGLYIMSAYNLDPGTDEVAALNQNSSFLKIRSGNSNHLPNAHDDLNYILSSLEGVINSETGDILGNISSSDKAEISDDIDMITDYINQVQNIEFCTEENDWSDDCSNYEYFMLDISGFMNDPLNNLKTILPDYTIVQYVNSDCIEWDANSGSQWIDDFDFTFGGLLPNGSSSLLDLDDDDLDDWDKVMCPED